MARYVNRTPCPECGSVRVRALALGGTDDDQQLRYRGCEDCGHKFTTVEVVVPGYSIYQLDSVRKWRNKMRLRETRGYHGGIGGPPPKATPKVIVTVTVKERAA